MTRPIFIFISSIFFLTPLVLLTEVLTTALQLIICLPIILFLGIPHGAIDNVLYIDNIKKLSLIKFIGVYLIIIGLNIGLWVKFPVISYVSFLFLSAYHFGQSQFANHLENKNLLTKLVYITWGISILSGLVFFNLNEISAIATAHPEFAVFEKIHVHNSFYLLFLGSTVAVVFLLGIVTISKLISVESLLMELLVLTLILFCFFLMPFLIGFTLYFVILHSLKVLREEFSFLILEKVITSFGQFIKLIAPFSFLSLCGIGFFLALIYLEFLKISYGYLALIIVSSITVPHVFVMNKFYNLLSDRGINRQLND